MAGNYDYFRAASRLHPDLPDVIQHDCGAFGKITANQTDFLIATCDEIQCTDKLCVRGRIVLDELDALRTELDETRAALNETRAILDELLKCRRADQGHVDYQAEAGIKIDHPPSSQ